MSRPRVARLLTYAIALLPFLCADAATILYAIGGFGGGHGSFDDWLFTLGCPGTLLTSRGLLLPPLEMNDFLLIVWYPAVLNFMFWWGPIALGLYYCTRNWKTAWPADQRGTTPARLLIEESDRVDAWLQHVESD